MVKSSIRQPIIVVGSGVGALPAATVLAEAGHKIIILERGKLFTSGQIRTDRFDYELSGLPWRSNEPSMDELDEQPWRGDLQPERAFTVGGTSKFFQALAELPSKNVLNRWGLDNPLFHRFSSDVVNFLQIAGRVQPHHPLNSVSAQLHLAAQKLGWAASPTDVAILSRPDNNRPACNHCGLCVYGCKPGDKSSADLTWLPRLLRTGNAQLKTGTRVERINLSSTQIATSVTYRQGGELITQPAAAVIVAAGTLETPYLLKRSQQVLAPNGIGNRHVGHNINGTISATRTVLVNTEKPANGHAGIPIDLMVTEFEKTQGVKLYQGRNLGGITGPVSVAKLYARINGPAGLREWMRSNYGKLAVLCAMYELPSKFGNSIDEKNKRLNIALPKKNSLQFQFAQNKLDAWVKAAQASPLFNIDQTTESLSGAMLRGSCRIGDANAGAINQAGLLHGYQNIYVTDASAIPPGMIGHPSLFVQTFSYFVGQQILANAQSQKGGATG